MISGIALTIALGALLAATRNIMMAAFFWIKATHTGAIKIDKAPKPMRRQLGLYAVSIIGWYATALASAFIAGVYING